MISISVNISTFWGLLTFSRDLWIFQFANMVVLGEKIVLDKNGREKGRLRGKDAGKKETLYIVAERKTNHNYPWKSKILQNNQEKSWKFLKKGIDFMENLRYNWTVHEHNTEQEV